MSLNITPSVQLTIVDPGVPLTANPLLSGSLPLYCANGAVLQEVSLPAATASLALAFPVGVTTATVIFISSQTATDLIVKVGGTPFSLPLPLGQGMLLYGLTSSQVSLNSVLGGIIQYAVGG